MCIAYAWIRYDTYLSPSKFPTGSARDRGCDSSFTPVDLSDKLKTLKAKRGGGSNRQCMSATANFGMAMGRYADEEEDDLKGNVYRSGSAPTIMKNARAPDSDEEKDEKERQLEKSSTSSVRHFSDRTHSGVRIEYREYSTAAARAAGAVHGWAQMPKRMRCDCCVPVRFAAPLTPRTLLLSEVPVRPIR
jgi:hypothetical protein